MRLLLFLAGLLIATLGVIALAWFAFRQITSKRGEAMSAAGLAEF